MNFYTKVTVGGQLAGNVFCSRWVASGKTICWVTQLVVNRNYRERGLASSLLASLRRDDDDMYGIISSHPAALLAFTKAFGSTYTDQMGCLFSPNILQPTLRKYQSRLYANMPTWP